MREKIEGLLQKYYEGNTSLAEENELREALKKVSGFEEEKQFFLGLQDLKSMEPVPKPSPKPYGVMEVWWKVAAILVFFVGLSWMLVEQHNKKEEAMAYAQVMEAFYLIQENMQKGTRSLGVIQDLKHLGTTNELFNIKEKEE